MATLTLRILTNSGDTTKGSTLTNAELDQNLISLNNELKLATTNIATNTADILTKADVAGDEFTGGVSINRTAASSVTDYALHVKHSGGTTDAGRSLFSQGSTYGLALTLNSTSTTSATGSYQWVNVSTGAVLSTPIQFKYNGDVAFATGTKIQGDFSNATQSSRTAIQSSVTNGVTGVNVIPNGTATDTAIRAWNASDVTNGSYTDIATSAAGSFLRAEKSGTGSYLPLNIQVGGATQVSVSTAGIVAGSTTGYFSSPYTPASYAYASQHLSTTTAPFYSTCSLTGSAYYPMMKTQVTGGTKTVNFSIGALHNSDNTIDMVLHRINGDGTLGANAMRWTDAGTCLSAVHLTPSVTNTYDLGTTSLRWRNIYTQDLHLSNGIGDYTVIEGVENLYLVNNKTNKSFKFALIEVDPAEVPAKSQVS